MIDVEPLETHCEWTRDSLADRYVFELTDDHRAELDAALMHAGSQTDDVLDIEKHHFPLPTLGPELDRTVRVARMFAYRVADRLAGNDLLRLRQPQHRYDRRAISHFDLSDSLETMSLIKRTVSRICGFQVRR